MILFDLVVCLVIQCSCAAFQWQRSRRYPALRPLAAWYTIVAFVGFLIVIASPDSTLYFIGLTLFTVTLVGLGIAQVRYARWTPGAARRRKL